MNQRCVLVGNPLPIRASAPTEQAQIVVAAFVGAAVVVGEAAVI